MSSHAVSGDADSFRIQLLERREQGLGKLLGNVGVHVVALVVGFLGGVDVETSARSKVISIVLAGNAEPSCHWQSDMVTPNQERSRRTRAGVRVDNGDSLLTGAVLEEALLGAVVAGTGEAREIDEHGDLGSGALKCLRREIQVELHLAVGRRSLVSKLQELASEGRDGSGGFDRHFRV